MADSTHQRLHADIPDLRVVPLADLVPHELQDSQRAVPLAKRLPEEGTLLNPPIITPLGMDDNRFMILDGTNRVVAFELLKIPHILVQVVPYSPPHTELHTWYHVISHMPADIFKRRIADLPHLKGVNSDAFHARAMLARRAILAYYILPNGEVEALQGGGLDLHKHNRLLQAVVDSYIHDSQLNRTNIDNLNQLLDLYPDMTAIMIFPHYEPVEVLDLAQHGLRVPPGITRHLIHGRALRVNYPLDRLTSHASLEAKNLELKQWLQQRFEQKRVRYYAESTYNFDE